MVPLDPSDPLWQKLDSAYGYLDIGKRLAVLAENWKEEDVSDLLFNCLIHQESCYSAAYAAVPQLLALAKRSRNKRQKLDIALFFGWLAHCALREAPREDPTVAHLPGLILTLSGWNRSRDVYRSLVSHAERRMQNSALSEFDLQRLAHYREVLSIKPPTEADFQLLTEIGEEFISSLPVISRLCEDVFVENLNDENACRHLMSGIAAARRMHGLADLLESGDAGDLICISCGLELDYGLLDGQLALYQKREDPVRGPSHWDRNVDGSPRRAIAMATPTDWRAGSYEPVGSLFHKLAAQSNELKLHSLVSNIFGTFVCPSCKDTVPVFRN